MIRPRLLLTLVLVAALGLASCGSGDAGASPSDEGGITLTDATVDWPANPEVGAVRLRVHNDGATADELVGASSDASRSTMVHRSVTDAQGRATMEMAADLEIPARSTVTFEPGGLHIMLDGLQRDLEVGDEVQVTLVFRDAGPITTTARVVEPGSVDLGGTDDGDEEASHGH